MKNFVSLAALAALAGSAAAQTFTDCNPLEKTCPADPALGTEHTWWFNSTLDDTIWNMTTGTFNYTADGADFTIYKANTSTLLQSNFYIFFGVVESWVKMAKGGRVVLESDDLDEIDWEWVGYNTSAVQTNFFGKGNTTSYDRGATYVVENADTEYHNYTTYWNSDRLEWWVDGTILRTLHYSDSLALGGKNYPQTPCRVKFSNWPAGIPSAENGTIQWAGGLVNYDEAPFTMSVQRVRVQDFHTGKEYTYGDQTGSFESIQVTSGNSTALEELNKAPAKSLAEKWDDLGNTAHIGIYSGAAAAGVLAIVALGLCCMRQRRKGRLEHALDDSRHAAERTEMQNFQNDWKQTEWKHNGYSKVGN
ncbi:extracellular glycosidase [Penicillium canariense]|uniref:chitinase n=1 Tax=Penicillium canariense TaxID=189055 RepID=A0A9W9HR21_9EURO|nr:extracellular glycosidase [Penicillium canariense]KAJ5153070.1 extracellular glycosidase [Penicillium canariense]